MPQGNGPLRRSSSLFTKLAKDHGHKHKMRVCICGVKEQAGKPARFIARAFLLHPADIREHEKR